MPEAVGSDADRTEGESDVSTSSEIGAGSTPRASTRNGNRPANNGRPTTRGVDAQHRFGDESGPPPTLLERGGVPTEAGSVGHGLRYVGQLASIATGGSPIHASKPERRLTDPAFTDNPIYRRVMQSYLAFFGRGRHRSGEVLLAAAGAPEACGLVLRGR